MSSEAQAKAFVEGRLSAAGFPDYPGALPGDLATAYAVQQAAIAQWPDRIAGWKVGRIAPPLADRVGEDRFVCPIFAADVHPVGQDAAFPAFADGFAAFEAELVIVAAADAPPEKADWSIEEARALAGAMHVAVEVAGSPLASINDLGAIATIAGFGNNNGLILGAEVPDWRALRFDDMPCTTTIDGMVVGQAAASAIPGSPLAALAFALSRTARLGTPIRRGDLISTGAITGVHAVRIGQQCEADFGRLGQIACTVTRALPRR